MQFSLQTIAAAALFFASANAHIKMATPAPPNNPDTSPLSPSGSDYPCKAGYKGGNATPVAAGGSVKLTFSGTANHGGGSCQISITKDKVPTAASKFKVIYSIVGGCPGVDGANNAYDIKIPSEVPTLDGTIAWTWFNKIGNREMYMNCAPISVTGSGSDAAFNSLPDMAIYNVKSQNDCGTTEGVDTQFPNPGKYIGGTSGKTGPPTGSCATGGSGSGSSGAPAGGNAGAQAGSGAGAGNAGAAAPSAGSGQRGGGAATTTRAAATGKSTGAPGVFAENPNGGNAAAATPTATRTATATATVVVDPSSAPAAPAAPAGSAAPASPPAADGSCSPDGAVVCSSDGAQFGLCNWGKVTFQPVAAGTKCANGEIRRRWEFRA